MKCDPSHFIIQYYITDHQQLPKLFDVDTAHFEGNKINAALFQKLYWVARVYIFPEAELFEIELPDTVLTIYVCKMSVAVSECQP